MRWNEKITEIYAYIWIELLNEWMEKESARAKPTLYIPKKKLYYMN